nr:type I inositol polyphosphate 5-phosphatase 4-like [Tanacetum cinerariifolium]
MDNNYKSKVQKFGRWISTKHKSKTRSLLFKRLSDESGSVEYKENEDDSFMSLEMDPCMMTNELRFQEIVPLKAKNVIGGEDTTEATNWNVLIGQILNDKCACRWTSPMTDPITSDQVD